MTKYRIPSNVHPTFIQKRPILSTPQGGKIAIDADLLALWERADGCTLDEIISIFASEKKPADLVCAALACLAEAGLLERNERSVPRALATTTGALISVIIVSFNSREWLAECLPTIIEQTYAPLEIIVVDNASSDGSAEWVQENYPSARLVRLDTPRSFACAINQGVYAAAGSFFLILNPDVRLEPDAIAQMAAVAQRDNAPVIVAAKLKLWWATGFLNGLGNRVGAISWGTDNAIGHLDLGQFDAWRELPSACFAAALIPRAVWESVGAVDEGFPMYYEDSEWSYRARLLGYTVRAAPCAVVYHAFGGRVPSGKSSELSARKLRQVAFGRLRFAVKILGWRCLLHFLRNYASEDWANSWRVLLQRDWRAVGAYVGAWRDFVSCLPALLRKRGQLQARRVCSDDELFALQREMPVTLLWQGLPELTMDLVQDYYLPLIASGRTRTMPEFANVKSHPHLLIVSNDVVDAKMGGPGMRYLEMARALGAELNVTLAVPVDTSLQLPNVRLVHYREEHPSSLQILVENCDVALISGYIIQKFPFLHSTRARLVVDLYDPFPLENLHYYLCEPIEAQATMNRQAIEIVNQLARVGDFFICGSERQRDFWMGMLAANGRVNPYTFARDPALRALIEIVGIGLPGRELEHRPFLRGVHPAFSDQSRIVLWGGGIWDWLDPLTLVRAWRQVIAAHPQARLVFLGTRHPNRLVPTHRVAAETQSLATETGERDRTIFFFEWLTYADREAMLCEADVGVVLHPLHIETRYSIRTRVLDYMWARLPVLVSDGDVTSEWVQQYGIGRVVPPLDSAAVADALVEILAKPKADWAAAFEPIRSAMCWQRVVEPLKQYCLHGSYAPDRQTRRTSTAVVAVRTERLPIARALYILRTNGWRILLHRVKRYIQWRLASV